MKVACIGFFGMRLSSLMIAILLCVASYQNSALAVEFELEKGRQFELCRDMAANLAAFPDLMPEPFDLPFDPKLEDFRWVEWTPLNPVEHVDVLRQSVLWRWNFKGPEEALAIWEREMSLLLEMAEKGEVLLQEAHFDANHDGQRERVYRFSRLDQYKWPATYDPRGWAPAWHMIVMPEDDAKAHKDMEPHWARGGGVPFYYKGRIFYFDPAFLNIDEPKRAREGEDFGLIRVCRFKAIDDH